MSSRRKTFYFILVLAMVIALGAGVSLGIEKAKYQVNEKQGKFEIRQYEAQIVAETVVDADFDDAGNIAFRRLFKYISGHNRTKASISMTAPVTQTADSAKIAMTAPVSQHRTGDKYVVGFLMPAKYSLETLPEPRDASVVLREVKPGKFAALRYSGSWSRKKYESQKGRLEAFIEDRGLKVVGEPIFARYDPPFQLSFLRRNEVLIPVK